MPRPDFKTIRRRDSSGYVGRDFSHEKPITVPDQNLSVKDLLRRFTRGLPPPGIERDMIYDEDGQDFVSPELGQDRDLTDIDYGRDELSNIASAEKTKRAQRKARKTETD